MPGASRAGGERGHGAIEHLWQITACNPRRARRAGVDGNTQVCPLKTWSGAGPEAQVKSTGSRTHGEKRTVGRTDGAALTQRHSREGSRQPVGAAIYTASSARGSGVA